MMSDKVRGSIQVALEQLHDERVRIENAIARLEVFLGDMVDSATASVASRARLSASTHRSAPRRRLPIAAKQRSREGWTDEARAAAAERMRQRWADRRAATSEGQPQSRALSDARRAPAAEVGGDDAANDSTESGRKGWTVEARAAAAERMRRYWQERRKSDAVSG